MCCIDTKLFDIKQHAHKTSNFLKYIYSILTLFYVLYHTHRNFIITTQSSQNYLYVDVSIYPCIDIELCNHCFALPCECVPINIFIKEGKGELKHFKNLMKEYEICTTKCIDKRYHNDQSLMLIYFICII